MDKVNIFVDSILTESIKNPELDNAILSTLAKAKENNNSRKRSNRGGFQTEIADPFILNCLLQQTIFMLKRSIELPDTKVSIDAWINENKKGDYNSLHSHIGASYSGTYYVRVPKKDGELVFKRDPAVLWTRNQDIVNNNETSNTWILRPSKNLFVLFSSHIEHMVVPHNDDETRISVSFNVKLTKDG